MYKTKKIQVLFSCMMIVGLLQLSFLPQTTVSAATANLTITPITWNVIGLDSNNVNVGPNQFPVGARVCNIGDAQAVNVSSEFIWGGDATPAKDFIKLRNGSKLSYSGYTIDAGDCKDFYYEVEITRNSNAYNDTRAYTITASADGVAAVSTPSNREIYVEYLISQNRNATTNVYYGSVGQPIGAMTNVVAGGTMTLALGGTYDIVLDGKTATQGYNQLESFINFPNTIFQIEKIATTYTANSSTFVLNTNDMLYADACLWDNVVGSETYRECIGSDGKSGGRVITRYTIKIVAGAGSTQPLNTLLYDFSGSSYHYNSDFESGIRFATIGSPISVTKSFSPNPITELSSGERIATLTLNLTNSTGARLDNVSITDPLPTNMTVADSPSATVDAECLSAFSPVAGADTVTYTGSIASTGDNTCSLIMKVKVNDDGSYTNTTAPVFVNSIDTGVIASSVLAANTTSSSCAGSITLAQWTFADGFTTSSPSASTTAPGLTVSAASGSGLTATAGTDSNGTAGSGSWALDDIQDVTSPDANEYIEFQIDTTKISSITLNFDYQRETNGPQFILVRYGASSVSLSDQSTIIVPDANWNSSGSIVFSSGLNTGGSTLFRIYPYNKIAPNETASQDKIYIDDVTFTGCINLDAPTMSKNFSPDPINSGGTSTLTFTLTNINATALTGVSFADALPTGMTIASTPSVNTTGCGSPTVTASAGGTSIGFTGGTIQGKTNGINGVCTVSVNVTAPDKSTVYTNTSGYISSAETGVNTGAGGSATDTLTVNPIAPVIDKVFSPNPIPVGETSILTITITNPNQNTQLTNLAFTDSYPANLVNSLSPAAITNCGGTVTAASGGDSVTLSGDGTLDAGKSCSITVNVTSNSVASYPNSTSATASASAVLGTLNLTSNTASDTLVVEAITPEIILNKEIGLSATGPWSSTVNVSAGTNVYYRFTIENTGDVNLSPVWVVDDKLSGISACSWPATLPAASNGNPVATCVVGPVIAGSTSSTNTATAKGTYSGTTYSSNTSSATYNITSLSLTKSVTPTIFTASTTTLSYSYTITNNGSSPVAGTFSISDTNATVTCTQPSGGSLAVGASMTCSASYALTDRDRSIGYVTNIASGSVVISGGGTAKTNTTSATSVADKPDLVVSKSATFSGGQAIINTPFTWTLTVSNNGGGTATFADGQKVLTDTLPSGANYTAGTPDLSGLTNNSGTLSCLITGSELSCIVSSGSLVIESGKSFTATVSVTPTSTSTLTNMVTVDPDKTGCDAANGCITESNEGNNTGQSEVTVSAALPNIKITKTNDVSGSVNIGQSFTWILTITNDGASDILFSDTQHLLSDVLPSGPTYGSISVTKTDVTGSTFLDCSINSGTLTCKANGGVVTLPSSKSFTVDIPVSPTSVGTLSNTAVVNPDFFFAESNTSDNSSIDTVAVNDPALTLTKTASLSTDTDGDGKADAGDVITYTFSVQNTGNVTLTNITINDPLLSSLSCTTIASLAPSASSDVTCASGNTYTVPQSVIDDNGGGDGDIDNTATATGKDPSGNDVTSTDTRAVSLDLTVTQTGMLVVTLYEDGNNDALRQNNELVLPNSLIIRVYDSSGNEVASLSTTSGVAVFSDLPVGTYRVVKTQSIAGYLDSSSNSVNIQVTAGQTSRVDYGHYKIATGKKYSLSGYVWHDQDVDRIFDPGETPLARKVDLLDANGNLINSSISSVATGYFEFTNLESGIYSVKEHDLSPYLFSSTINYKWVIVGPDTMAYMPGGSMLANFESDTLISQNIKPLFQSSGSNLLFGDYTRPLNCSVSSGDPVLDASAGSFPPSVSPPSAYFMQFQVGNQGDADVTNVRVTVPLPANLDVNAVNITYRTYVGSGSDSGYSSSITDNNITIVFNRITSNDVYNIQVSTNVVEGSPASVSTINAAIVSYDRVAGDTGCGDLTTNNTSPFNLNILGTRLIEPYAPDTGFAPGRVTAIPERPESLEYQKLDEVRLKIPNLRMDVPIVGIPYINDWNVTWLSNNAGWLEGTSYMGGAGNSVLVGHNYLPSGSSGPFIHLAWLRKNDLIYVEQGNQLLVYKVKYVGVVNPDNPLIFQNENTSTLTLVTCKDYDAQTDVYLKRIVVKAALMEVRSVKAGAPILNSLMALLIDFIDRNES